MIIYQSLPLKKREIKRPEEYKTKPNIYDRIRGKPYTINTTFQHHLNRILQSYEDQIIQPKTKFNFPYSTLYRN